MFRGLLYGSYRKPRELLWIIGMAIFVVLMAEGFFGYLLPWGNMSFWAAQVIVSLVGAIPGAGVEGFAELLRANHRPVRLHGAMMLAYLGDQRAKAGALDLRKALRESEGPYLDRVLATQGDLISCDWQWSESGRVRDVAACVYNTSSKPVERAGLAVRALDRVFDSRNPVAPPPLVIAESVVKLPGTFAPQQGRRVISKLDTDNPDGRIPETLEVVTDLFEHL
jgi:hypothetical protein